MNEEVDQTAKPHDFFLLIGQNSGEEGAISPAKKLIVVEGGS
jgi:hypothetical protein